jgi:hypothetical protein
MQHNNKARKAAIVLTSIGIAINTILFIIVSIIGLNETFYLAPLDANITFKNFTFFGNVVEILNIKDFYSLIVASMILSAFPFAILISEKAEKEFTINPESN